MSPGWTCPGWPWTPLGGTPETPESWCAGCEPDWWRPGCRTEASTWCRRSIRRCCTPPTMLPNVRCYRPSVAPGGTLLVVHLAIDVKHGQAHGFDPADYVSLADVASLLDE